MMHMIQEVFTEHTICLPGCFADVIPGRTHGRRSAGAGLYAPSGRSTV